MKKVTKFLMILSLTVVFISCGGSKVEEQFYGTWKESGIELTLEDGSEMSNELTKSTENVINEMLAKKKTIEFMTGEEDSKYKMTTTEESVNGTFMAFDLDGEISIAFFSDNGEASKMIITEITENKMVSTEVSDGLKLVSTYKK